MEILHHACPIPRQPNPSATSDACRPHHPRLIGRGELPELARFQTHLQRPLLQVLSKSAPDHVSSIAWQCVQKGNPFHQA
jgi:hypothetical protein